MSYDGRSNSGYAGSGYADSAYPGYVPGGQPASGYVPPLGESYGKNDREYLEDFQGALAQQGKRDNRREPSSNRGGVPMEARQSTSTWVKVMLFIFALFLIVMIVGFVIDFPEDERDGRRFRRFRRLCRRTN